jgi:hypothetical protein
MGQNGRFRLLSMGLAYDRGVNGECLKPEHG